MLFKKKYARSDWFQGLLDAEDLHKNEHWNTNAVCCELRGCTEYENGVYDYVWFMTRVNLIHLAEKLND